MGEEKNSYEAFQSIIMFSFTSIVFVFVSLVLLGSFNNFALDRLISISNTLVSIGLIDNAFASTAEDSASTLLDIISYLDLIWFGAFLTMATSSVIFSYFVKRENYFGLLTMTTIGIIIVTFIGGIIIQVVEWFRDDILNPVFPTISDAMPLFTWYIDNIGVINLIIIGLCIIANFVDLDLSKFNQRKNGDKIDEV